MDREARNAIERATQQARVLLEADFAAQLEGVFDVLRNGHIAPKAGPHLIPRQAFQRDRILAAIEHKRAAGMSAADAVRDYLRDAAFTALNRFIALKMLETRQLVQECITKGEQSSGYREFCGLAPGVALLPESDGYRLYIEGLFDELSTEVKVLFDRRDTASVLWPKRATFEQLLDVLNATKLSAVWSEDETIGWVYQFFNSGDERKRMREESQAPRNSRELAIRNQFFTPRYVVEFLVDNTLGRTWLEMHGEGSALAQRCRQLVRTAEEPPRTRQRKDPRDLRILDPACGSGHFLLYCFDLLLTIYDEAWASEALGPPSKATGRGLRDDYPDLASLRRAAPALIVEHNLYGVDIDPRAAQIAPLALWVRAQRAWQDFRIPAMERPSVRRTHVILAEPMPGDTALVEEFAARLDPPLLRDLFRKMVSEMRLAGELGPLLPVEEGIAAEVHKGREQFVTRQKELAKGYLPGLEPLREQGELDISGIDDDRFFHEAEARIIEALRDFAEAAAGSTSVRRRLFSDDATQGIALIDVLRTRFDVVLMNPPFGQPTVGTYSQLRATYPGAHADIFASFVRRGRALAPEGFVGAITSRSFLLAPRLESFRRRDVIPALELLADLGLGVMDTARVESAAYILGSGTTQRFLALDCRRDRSVVPDLLSPARFDTSGYRVARSTVQSLPQCKLLYSLPSSVVRVLHDSLPFEPTAGTAREGMKSFENERFLRLAWEVSPVEIGRDGAWHWFAKGGSHAFFYSPLFLLLNWRASGVELQAVNETINGSTAQVRQASEYWYRPGVTYSKRSAKGFSARCLPADVVFSSNGPAVLPNADVSAMTVVGWLNSRPVRALLHLQSNFGDYSTGAIKRLPWTSISVDDNVRLEAHTGELVRQLMALDQHSETSPRFIGPYLCALDAPGGAEVRNGVVAADSLLQGVIAEWDAVIGRTFGDPGNAWIADLLMEADDCEADESVGHPVGDEGDEGEEVATAVDPLTRAADLVSWAVGVAFGRFDVRVGARGKEGPAEGGPFDPLPACSPGMLTGEDGLPLSRPPAGYPLAFPETGVLVDDPGHPKDLTAAVRVVFDVVFGANADHWWNDVAALLDPKGHDLRCWLAGSFFEHHLKRYSKSRRKAPIFWQLGTPSGRYSVWLYAHRLTGDGLFQLQNEVVGQKLTHEERQLESLRQNTGSSSSASERKEIARQEDYVEELHSLLDEVKRVAPLWDPNLDDGVVLTMAPLWRLVTQHKPWRMELRTKWEDLAAGKYDWAHLAMHLWPERVVPKCTIDRSLAIAHGVGDMFWAEGADGKWKPRATPVRPVDELIRERSSPAVKAALNGLLGAPTGSAKGRAGRRRLGHLTATDAGSP